MAPASSRDFAKTAILIGAGVGDGSKVDFSSVQK